MPYAHANRYACAHAHIRYARNLENDRLNAALDEAVTGRELVDEENCGEIGPSIIVKMVVEAAKTGNLSSEKQRMQLNRCDRENGG